MSTGIIFAPIMVSPVAPSVILPLTVCVVCDQAIVKKALNTRLKISRAMVFMDVSEGMCVKLPDSVDRHRYNTSNWQKLGPTLQV